MLGGEKIVAFMYLKGLETCSVIELTHFLLVES